VRMSILNCGLHGREFVTPKFVVNIFFALVDCQAAEKELQVGCEKIQLHSLRTFVEVALR
jgi:hypothetical protein